MGDVAGSGGYWISVPADRIVAQAGTITGSIGVVAGKLAAAEAWSRIGIDWGELHEGRNATFSVALQPYTDSERARLSAMLDAIYQEFKDRVAEGRSMDPNAVEDVAKGRVWTGAQAHERGLVDELGGMHRALQLARGLIGLPEDAPINLKGFPARRAIPVPERKEGSDPVSVLVAMLLSLAKVVRDLGTGPSVELRTTDRLA
jgi:protease-4